MARVRTWTTSTLALFMSGALACVPPGESDGSGSTPGAGGRGGSSAGSGGSSPPAGGGGGTGSGGSAPAASTGGTTGGGSGGASGQGGRGGSGAGNPGSGGAGAADAGGSEAPAMAAPKLSTDVLPIAKANCARAGCHDPMKKEHGMDVSTVAGIMTAWVNKMTADHCKNNAAVVRVTPFKPEASFVVTLISTPMYCNEVKRMPPPPLPMLTANEIKTIRDWVAAGAKND
jgi:hypothetical protein